MRLKEIREEKEITQKEMAKLLNVSRSVYGMWEQEHDFIPLKRLNDFCNIFDVSLDYVLELNNNLKYPNLRNNIDKNIIKLRVKDLRKEAHLTQQELAIKLNITRSLISKYENGINLILTSFLIEYAKFFNISADYIVGRIDKKVNIKEKVAI